MRDYIIIGNAHAFVAICDHACDNQPNECKKLPMFSSLLFRNLQTICTNKKSVTTTEFNGLSSEIYRNGIPHSGLKILAKI